ncbi:LacI family DNA-binding transcriptional regulator [Kribbella sp. CA-293567]|uniref:LacI family DNA-binding transcriptional regulator n=1 Tax=Kribbella sp. CA-293567 TaxID=3002436 RepID=UPI0022DD4B6F|nr:LacI family DNA-binding transcriptional regulator [Kribbella sp. CA-293567]WBQ03141.1 LacI family DNA-binding transcriptional regulator [Kribbella sp. CA-293567]
MQGQDSGSPTLEQVAALAGVSRATVSRVVNGSPKVLPETVAAVERAIGVLGYVPNRAARALVTRRTDSVALVVPEPDSRVFSDPFFAGILRGISMTLAPTSSQLVLLIEPAAGDDQRLLRYLRGGHVDGAIIVSHHGRDNVLQELAHLPLPIVFSARPLGVEVPVASVDVDNVAGARTAVEYLLSIGRRKVGTIAGPVDMTAGIDRLTGYQEAVRTAGITEAIAYGDFTADGGEQATVRLLDEHPDLDGIFVANDLMATATLRVLSQRGKRVPADVAVVGFDDSVVATTTTPKLTTVRQPVEKLGTRLAEILLAKLAGADLTSPEIFETELIVRGSA